MIESGFPIPTAQALESTPATLRTRIAGFEAQTALAGSTDFPPGK
jgi:hypothetical protein